MKHKFAIARDWAKSNWQLLLTITALVGIFIRVEIAIADSQRLARGAASDVWDAKSQASRAERVAEDAESQASRAKRVADDAKRVAEDAKSSADSALAEAERVVRALRRLP